MKNIITIQHTEAVHHNNGMVGSWTNWELTELGKSHAENIGRKLFAELKGQTYKIYCCEIVADESANIILASHGGTLAVWHQVWVGEGVKECKFGSPGSVSFMGINADGKRIIQRLNNISYIEE